MIKEAKWQRITWLASRQKGISKRDEAWLRQATKIAQSSSCRYRHGCIITVGGSVQAVGVNSDRNNPNIVSDPMRESSIHAEHAALRALDFWCPGATIYVARAGWRNRPTDSHPCDQCIDKIKKAGIKRIVYTQ